MILGLLLVFCCTTDVAAKDFSDKHKRVIFQNRLHIPTFFTKIDTEYFIVDCYNNRIIYTTKLSTPIGQWDVLDAKDLSWPHSMAYDGKFYVVDDTEAHRVIVYSRDGNTFRRIQTINDVGKRPHRTIYDPVSNAFYVLGSMSQTITKLHEVNGLLAVAYTKHLPFLNNAYVRSMRIVDGKMFFVSGPGYISVAEYSDDSYKVVKKYRVPRQYTSMNDIVKFNGSYFISAFKTSLMKCESLSDFSSCKKLYDLSDMSGVPYYFSAVGKDLYVTEIGGGNSVYKIKNYDKKTIKPTLVTPLPKS